VALTSQFVIAPHDHVVQFYGHDDELAESVGRYLAESIAAGGVAVAIATEAHRRAFTARLAEAGIDVPRARADGRLILLDAAETKAALVIDGRLAPHRFDEVVGDLIRDATADGRTVAAYGEIVAVMWADGYVTAALELEPLWNGLRQEREFFLSCGYPLRSVGGEGAADALREVGRQHPAVVGTSVAVPRRRCAPIKPARTFAPTGRAPMEARRFVTGTLGAWGRRALIDDGAVIATELATNAVVHARTDFTVSVSRRPDGTIRIAVSDASPEPPRQRQADPFDSSGRGLRLVATVAARWGSDSLPDGKVVWADLGVAR
jgi:MEDS: MEthanogen/methylotroph, DcmR Sensory domain